MEYAAKVLAVLLSVCACRGLAAPAYTAYGQRWFTLTNRSGVGGAGEVGAGRIFWAPLGDILESLPFLPFTVNVPDALSSMWQYVSSWLPGGGGGGGGVTGDEGSRPPAKKKKKKPEDAITRSDLIDYFLYDR